jgi:hypothetical protein
MAAAMSTRSLLLGDWHPWMRDGIDVLRALLAAGAAGFALAGDGRGALVLGLAATAAWAVRPLLLPRAYDLCVVLAATLQGWGEALGFYDSVTWFDTVVHFTVPLLGSPVVYIALARLDVVPDPRDETHGRHYVGMAIVAFAIGGCLGALWEIVEWFSDNTFGSELQEGNEDTVRDLMADSAGALCGAALLVAWARYSWGSVRRIPGENRFEEADA